MIILINNKEYDDQILFINVPLSINHNKSFVAVSD